MNRRDFISYCCLCILSILSVKKVFNDFTVKNASMLNYVEVQIADHCNLNCKYCSHFSPIADTHFYDLKQYEKDVKRLSKITNKMLKRFRIMGGEPLLNSNIIKYFEISRRYFPYTDIRLVTNCVLLPKMSDDFWRSLNKNNISIEPSIYDVEIDWKKILEKATEFDIYLMLYKPLTKYFLNINLDLSASQRNFFKCRQKCFDFECYNLVDGKLYICPVVAYIKYFNKYFNQNVEISKGDYVELDKIKNMQDLTNWIEEPKPFCKYCKDRIPMKWELGKTVRSITEWVTENK
ncbi:MAG: radical SAM protein [Candidatus Gastranaerophilaceae bacterium]